MNPVLKKIAVFVFVSVFFITSAYLPGARAAFIDTSVYLNQQENGSRVQLKTLIEREDVKNQMILLGVNPDDAQKRLASLTDSEVRELQNRINDLPAAGSGVFVVLGIVLVVFIVLELVGLTNIFTRL